MFGCGNNLKVILYDEDQMQCFGGYLSGITMGEPDKVDIHTLEEDNERYIKGRMNTTVDMTIELQHEIIQLDPTTMKRIAKHNLEKENEGLLNEIEKNKREVEELKKLYKNLQERLQTISDIGSDIWENGAEYKKDDDDWEF